MTGSAGTAQRRGGGILPWILSLLFAFVLGEVVLRVAGFHYELKAQVIQLQAPNREKVFEGYAVEPDLLWTRKDYRERLGRALEEFPEIVFMGDSCTEFGDYDRRLMRLLSDRRPDVGARSFVNFGCAGWSTFQGRRQLERDVRRIRPKLVTIWYGWNDHWRSVGVSDAEVARLSRGPLRRFQGLRLGQLLMKSVVGVKRLGARGDDARVSLPEFRENLAAMIRTAREAGAIPVVLTGPSPGLPGEGRWVGALEPLIERHHKYADAAREVAAGEGALLCDLAREFEAIPREQQRDELFFKDEVHLTDAGNQLVAEDLFDCLAAGGLLDRLRH